MSNSAKITTGEALVRLTEQVKSVEYKIDDLKHDVMGIKESYVRKEEFEVVRNVVYGMVALILTSVVIAVGTTIGLG